MNEEVLPSRSRYEFSISSLAEFVDALKNIASPQSVFRGQSRFSDALLPGVQRPGVRLSGTDATWFEQDLLGEFKRQARPHLPHVPAESNDWEWLAIAQHHGLPTRLLDWTQNSAAALYFAVESPNGNQDSGVWCYHHAGNQAHQEPSPFDLYEPVLYHPPHISPRFTAQRACFTAHPPLPADGKRLWPGDLGEIRVLSAARVEIRRQLRTLGVDRASLFPDSDGVALAIRRFKSPLEDER